MTSIHFDNEYFIKFVRIIQYLHDEVSQHFSDKFKHRHVTLYLRNTKRCSFTNRSLTNNSLREINEYQSEIFQESISACFCQFDMISMYL